MHHAKINTIFSLSPIDLLKSDISCNEIKAFQDTVEKTLNIITEQKAEIEERAFLYLTYSVTNKNNYTTFKSINIDFNIIYHPFEFFKRRLNEQIIENQKDANITIIELLVVYLLKKSKLDEQQVGYVYKLECDCCDEIYIGSTRLSLNERLHQHNKVYKFPGMPKVYSHGKFYAKDERHAFKIQRLETVYFTNIKELRLIESIYMSDYKPVLNSKVSLRYSDIQVKMNRKLLVEKILKSFIMGTDDSLNYINTEVSVIDFENLVETCQKLTLSIDELRIRNKELENIVATLTNENKDLKQILGELTNIFICLEKKIFSRN